MKITDTLGISHANTEGSLNDLNQDQCSKIIEYFESHCSILKIKGSISSTTKFSFRKATVEEMSEEFKNIDFKTASPQESIPAKY